MNFFDETTMSQYHAGQLPKINDLDATVDGTGYFDESTSNVPDNFKKGIVYRVMDETSGTQTIFGRVEFAGMAMFAQAAIRVYKNGLWEPWSFYPQNDNTNFLQEFADMKEAYALINGDDILQGQDGRIGDLSSLLTTDKSHVVNAINENYSEISDLNNSTGDLSSLTTSDKSSLVGAINEVDGDSVKKNQSFLFFEYMQKLGSGGEVRSLCDLNQGVVVAGTAPSGQIYKSTDSGSTWSLVQRLGSESQVLSLANLGNGAVLAGTGTSGQIYKSTDSGSTWSLVQRLGSESQVLSFSSSDSGTVLAGTYPDGQVHKSTDSGSTWTLLQRLGSESRVLSFASIGEGVVLAGTSPSRQVYKSTEVYL